MAPLAFEDVVPAAEVVPEVAGLLVPVVVGLLVPVVVVTPGALIVQCQIKGYRGYKVERTW
jgi:hypothetical protein